MATWKKSRTPSALAHLSTRFCSSRLRASATPSALRFSGWVPNGSSIELDWSSRKTRAVGLLRLIWDEYGTGGSFPGGGRNDIRPNWGGFGEGGELSVAAART